MDLVGFRDRLTAALTAALTGVCTVTDDPGTVTPPGVVVGPVRSAADDRTAVGGVRADLTVHVVGIAPATSVNVTAVARLAGAVTASLPDGYAWERVALATFTGTGQGELPCYDVDVYGLAQ